MKLVPAEHVEAETEQDNGYFFQGIGAVRFTEDRPSQAAQPLQLSSIAVAAKHGVAVFADAAGA